MDGQVGRTKLRSETWNATANQWDFPQTPARVQLSLWPAGLASNGKGTIEWAGGLVNWDSPDIQNNGYYYATFQSVTVSCYNATSAPGTNTGKSYTYDSTLGTNNTVVDGDGNTILSSFLATGSNMTIGETPSSVSSGATSTPTVETVPGLSGGGQGQVQGGPASSVATSATAVTAPTGSDSGSGSAPSSAPSSGSCSGFCQNDGSGGSKSGAEKLGGSQDRVLKGSVFAGIVAVVAMMAL